MCSDCKSLEPGCNFRNLVKLLLDPQMRNASGNPETSPRWYPAQPAPWWSGGGRTRGTGRMAPGAWDTNPPSHWSPESRRRSRFPWKGIHTLLQLPRLEEARAVEGAPALALLEVSHGAVVLESIAQPRGPRGSARSVAPRVSEPRRGRFCHGVQVSPEKNRKWRAICERFRTIKCLPPLGQL